MKLTSIPRTWRHLRRYRQVIGIFLKYGFNDIVDAISKDLAVRFGEKIIPRKRLERRLGQSRAERLRCAIEELGPTFIKMGQVLSMRPDIIPLDISEELQKLQDKVAPIPFTDIERVIRTELQEDPEDIFSGISKKPYAAASIAQVHRATLKNGKKVVLKVQRPKAPEIINVDIEILGDLAKLLRRYFRDKIVQDPLALVEEFDKIIHRELDFVLEGKNINRFRLCFADDPTILIPSYYSEFSTSKLLVMDFVDGIKASNIEMLDKSGLDRKLIAQRGTSLSFRQVFEFGFFHADPHSGNIMVLQDNVIAPIDFGMVGRIDDETIDQMGDIITGFIRKDEYKIIRAFEHLGIIDYSVKTSDLKRTLSEIVDSYYGIPLKELRLSTLLNEFFSIVHNFKLAIPPRLSLVFKALLTAEGLSRMLYPDYDAVSEMKPYLQKIMLHKYDPRRKLRQSLVLLDEISSLIEEFPQRTRAILNKAASGKFAIQFEHQNLERLVSALSRSSNHIASALVIAALIVGSSLVMQVPLSPILFGYPLIGIFGYLLASVLGLKLIWDIFWNRRSDR